MGDGVLRSNATGENTLIHYKKLVDATYLQGEIPATSPPPYEVGEGVRSVTPSELTRLRGSATDYVVIGAGKTGQDACLWLLSIGLNPQSIQWVRPRDPWIQTRLSAQPGPGLETTVEIYSQGMEAAAAARSSESLFEQLEAKNVLVRIDPSVMPSCYAGAIISD